MLSTSLLGYNENGGCVAPMCLDGYGCFYNINDGRIFVAISAWRNSSESSASKLFNNFTSALEEMRQVVTFGASKI
jgi:carnitine O-octanoyltransferase